MKINHLVSIFSVFPVEVNSCNLLIIIDFTSLFRDFVGVSKIVKHKLLRLVFQKLSFFAFPSKIKLFSKLFIQKLNFTLSLSDIL